MSKIVIAIDGHSACGKSTLAADLARELGYIYITSGAMYRACTWYFLDKNIHYEDLESIKAMLPDISIEFKTLKDNTSCLFLNGKSIQDELYGMPVSKYVSEYSTISALRKAMVDQQKHLGKQKGIVMDGRDIGTVVFPDAELKIFLTSSIEARTRRRYEELLSKGKTVSPEEVQKNLIHRDNIDTTREDSPLKMAEDSVMLDNTNLNRQEQLRMVMALAELRIKN